MSTARSPSVKQVVRDLLDAHGRLRVRDVVDALRGTVSRQAVHQHLRAMVTAGELVQHGAGRATWYERDALVRSTYAVAGLSESDVWDDLVARLPVLRGLPEPAGLATNYLVTEMTNNAIDHSGSDTVTVRVRQQAPYFVVDVEDHGVGIFAKVAAALGNASHAEAAQRLMLGKFTTWPERHSGEGIFFSSRLAQVFFIDANGLRWTVDNERGDWALADVPDRAGTLVRFLVDPERAVPPSAVFRRFTDAETLRFDTTQAVVKMLELGVRFVSRSEAKRLAAGLEPFDHVVVDFMGVSEVGQGFVDELFRVWAAAHPGKRLEPVNMSEAVRFMVERGLPRP